SDENQVVVDELHEHHTQHGAQHRAAAAEDRRTAEDDSGDDVELGAHQRLRVGVLSEDHEDHAAERRQSTDEHVQQDLCADHLDTHASRGVDVAADGEDAATEGRVLQHPPHEDDDHDHRYEHPVQVTGAGNVHEVSVSGIRHALG